MTTIRPELGKITTVSVVLSAILFVLIQLIFNVPPVLMFLKVGFVVFSVCLFWIFFDKKFWRWGWLRRIAYFNLPPDLNGRWKGTLQRDGESGPHQFVLEIVQTYSHIQIHTFSSNSHSQSLTASFLTDEGRASYQVIFTWLCTTKQWKVARTTPASQDFYGTSIVDISLSKDGPSEQRILRDTYFTRRQPQTRGTTELKWQGQRVYNQFQDA